MEIINYGIIYRPTNSKYDTYQAIKIYEIKFNDKKEMLTYISDDEIYIITEIFYDIDEDIIYDIEKIKENAKETWIKKEDIITAIENLPYRVDSLYIPPNP